MGQVWLSCVLALEIAGFQSVMNGSVINVALIYILFHL